MLGANYKDVGIEESLIRAIHVLYLLASLPDPRSSTVQLNVEFYLVGWPRKAVWGIVCSENGCGDGVNRCLE